MLTLFYHEIFIKLEKYILCGIENDRWKLLIGDHLPPPPSFTGPFYIKCVLVKQEVEFSQIRKTICHYDRGLLNTFGFDVHSFFARWMIKTSFRFPLACTYHFAMFKNR